MYSVLVEYLQKTIIVPYSSVTTVQETKFPFRTLNNVHKNLHNYSKLNIVME